jgi:hypothetical protein
MLVITVFGLILVGVTALIAKMYISRTQKKGVAK